MEQKFTLLQAEKDGPHFLHRNGKGLLCPHFSPSNSEIKVEVRGTVDREQVQVRKHPPIGCGTHCALCQVVKRGSWFPTNEGDPPFRVYLFCASGMGPIDVEETVNAK